jgi:hypothetical protein
MSEFRDVGFNAEEAAAAEAARRHQQYRVAPSSARSRARIVTRDGEPRVVHEPIDPAVEARDAANAAISYAISCARRVEVPEHFTAEQAVVFWRIVGDWQAGGRRG